MYSIEQFCSQNVNTLIHKSGITVEPNISKLNVLIRSSIYYLEKKLISPETRNIIVDPRFGRLFNSKSKELRHLLNSNRITILKNNKIYIILLCYNSNLDLDSNITPRSYSSDDSLDNGENNEIVEMGEHHFCHNGGKIYLKNDKTQIEISNSMLMELFQILIFNKK
jgi:hypothetical protein